MICTVLWELDPINRIWFHPPSPLVFFGIAFQEKFFYTPDIRPNTVFRQYLVYLKSHSKPEQHHFSGATAVM
jgi:hypothetical protein